MGRTRWTRIGCYILFGFIGIVLIAVIDKGGILRIDDTIESFELKFVS